MNNYNNILFELEKELDNFTKKNLSLKHLLWDSFNDHKSRYKKDLELINRYFKGGNILDIGASPFHITFCLKKLGYDVVGLDLKPSQFSKFINKYDLTIEKCNIEEERFPFKNNSFDFIIFLEIFEHLRINPISTLKEINRVLKPNGILLLTTPNLYAIHKIFMFNFGMSFNDAYDQFDKLKTYGYVGHIREYSTAEVKKFLENTGFKVVDIIYQNYYSFFKYTGFKNNFILKLAGLIVDLLMELNPYWRRHQAFIAKKI